MTTTTIQSPIPVSDLLSIYTNLDHLAEMLMGERDDETKDTVYAATVMASRDMLTILDKGLVDEWAMRNRMSVRIIQGYDGGDHFAYISGRPTLEITFANYDLSIDQKEIGVVIDRYDKEPVASRQDVQPVASRQNAEPTSARLVSARWLLNMCYYCFVWDIVLSIIYSGWLGTPVPLFGAIPSFIGFGMLQVFAPSDMR